MTRGQLKVLCFMVPAIALITFLNLRKTKFCDACGRTLYPKSFFTPTPFCPHCGAQVK
jgi:rRNA maturation endonuclease Nob1